MQKKYYLNTIAVMALALLMPLSSLAQKYSFIPNRTLTESVKKDSTYVFDIYIKNLTSSPLKLSWEAIQNTLDTAWVDYSLCDYGTCFPGVPSGVLTMDPIPVNTNGFFGLNLTVKKSSGSGIVKLLLYEVGTSPSSGDTVTYIIDAVTGVNEYASLQNPITVYPNPTSNLLHIHFKDKILSSNPIELYNMIGEKVLEFNSQNTLIDVSQLLQGTYFMRVETTEGQIFTKRFNKF